MPGTVDEDYSVLVTELVSAKPESGAIALRYKIAGCTKILTRHLSRAYAFALHHELAKIFTAESGVREFPARKRKKRAKRRD